MHLKPSVPRHLVMSSGIGLVPVPAVINEMIINEQIKVKGCRFASSRGRNVKRRSASSRLRVYDSVTLGFNQHGAKRNVD